LGHLKIFISYPHLDNDIAGHVHKYLSEDQPYDVFLDESSIHVGEKWTKMIEDNIDGCDIFVLIITYRSLKSAEVNKEVEEALRQNKVIIPCKLEGLKWEEVKWNLSGFQGIEFEDRYVLARALYQRILNYNIKIEPEEDMFLKLLKAGKVEEFNRLIKSKQSRGKIEHGYTRPERKFSYRLDLGGIRIENVSLAGVDLQEVDICRANLERLDLTDANFAGANLGSVAAENAKLMRSHMQDTYLSRIDLSGADLSGADLSRALLLGAWLERTILSEANLTNSIIVGYKNIDGPKCDNADFTNSIIDNKSLVKHLKNNKAKNVPPAIRTREQLELKLQEKGYKGKLFDKIMQRSLFAESATIPS
jgi:uncharacterized protein YjbI with pentapeptide repeats